MDVLEAFLRQCQSIKNPRVMELGTRRVNPELRTKHDDWIAHAAEFVGVDYIAGTDVDVVADVHQLSDIVGREQFDIILTCSTIEHIKYPHLAAHQLLHTLRVGGLLFVHTVQTFPLHGFPHDYYRFSREGLAALFGTQMGFQTIDTEYQFPARIHSEREPSTKDFDAYLNVLLFGRKIAPTPDQYLYEFESFDSPS